MDKERIKGFSIIGVIYVLATVVGVVCYCLLTFENWWLKLFIADFVATVFTFIFSVIFKNSSVYDPYWSVQPIVIAFCFALENEWTLGKILILTAITVWGVRLTTNWAINFYGMKHQDWRYTMLAEKTGKFYPVINFVGIHLVPTIVVYFCTLPAVFVILGDGEFNPFSIIFFVTAILSVVLQETADRQMREYRKNRTTPFIEEGVWKYSRHPNYLAEITMWWSVGLYAVVEIGFSWYLLIGAVINTLLFTFVSIPMADNRQAKKEGFSEYKKRTHALLPVRPFGKI